MTRSFYARVSAQLESIRAEGLYKPERVIASRQGARVKVKGEDGGIREVLNFCANNYLGLAGDERVSAAAAEAARTWGAGLASVRFICGTQAPHKELERAIADYLGFDDAILFAAAFDANGGVFETLLSDKDAVISDALNHASIIDGVRLSKAKRYRFENRDMGGLETQLKAARGDGAETVLIVTDGVFSMDGYIADLAAIVKLARAYDAIVMIDECHATGFLGEKGRGTAALCGVEGQIDIISGTFGKALGGAMGGFIVARAPVVELLRQRARPYLFSNALAPSICGASLEAVRIAQSEEGDRLRALLIANAAQFRAAMTEAGFKLQPGEHPIIPVMLGDAVLAQRMAQRLLEEGVFVTGFSFPVVPRGLARIRTQMSAAHSADDVDAAVAAFTRVGRELGAIA